MWLTIKQIAETPTLLTYETTLPTSEKATFRPLVSEDVAALTDFLESLSAATRKYYNLPSYDNKMAQTHCDAIGIYDKLRFVVELDIKKKIIAIFDFSFDLMPKEIEKLQNYNPQIDLAKVVRIGFGITDEYQSRGVGSHIFPYLLDVATQCGKDHLLLRGGVFAENQRAVNFYTKHGFKKFGEFEDKGLEVRDMIREI